MAKSKLEADIPGIGSVTVSGNIATEDAIQDLIKAVDRLDQSKKVETKSVQEGLDDTTESLEDFTDEVDRAKKSQENLNKKIVNLVDRAENLGRGFTRNVSSTASMTDMIESAGEVAAKFAGGVGGLIPIFGEGTARLAEGAAMAGTALLSMAVGAIESFQALNRSIMDGGLLLRGGFSGLADAADIAGLPINQFGEAVMANISRLRLLESGAPGGMRRLSQGFKSLQEANEENLDTLYALGFTTQDVVTGMADVALNSQRAGRNLSSEELAATTFDYLKNLRELNKLTGQSADSIQSQVEANRTNMFIQRGLAGLSGEQRAAAEDFVAAMQAAGAGGLAAYALTGEISSTQQGLAVEQNRAFANIMRQYFIDLQSGVDPAVAMARYQETMALNQDLIAAQADANNQMFGQTLELADQYGEIGAVNRLAIEQARAALAGEDPLAGTRDPETGEDTGRNLSITMGALTGATNDAQAAIQRTFVEGLDRLSGEDGALTNFAQMISGAAVGAEAFSRAVFEAIDGDFAGAARELGLLTGGSSDTPVAPGTQGNTAAGDNPLELIDPNYIPGAADGNILTGPSSGYLTELHGTEAVVPLPDGRTIPVSLSTGGLTSAIIDALETQSIAAAESVETSVSTFANSLDNSRSLPELVNISKNMLNQMTATAQKMDLMVKAMEQANTITRTSAYVRA